MTRVTFAWNNLYDLATITPSSQNPSFPATNLKNRWHTKTWRSTDDTGTLTESIVANMGSAQGVQFFAAKNHNFSSSAVVKIQANSSNSWSTPPVDVTLTLNSGLLAYYWSSVQTYQYWRYYIVDSAPVAEYLETGRLWLGPMFSPSVNIINDYGKNYEDPSGIMESDGGQILTNQKSRFKTLDISFEYITDDDLTSFEEMIEDRGYGRELFFTRDRDAALTTTMYCRIGKAQTKHVGLEQYYNLGMSLVELR